MIHKNTIITLCYNQLEQATKPFIESLYKFTSVDFELIIVNNASTDGTYEYLEDLKNQYNNIKIIHNSENLGYSKGFNTGLKIAKGELLFLLNNDVLFTPNWLECMAEILETNKEIGILSTMTNYAQDQQLVENADAYTVENYLNLVKENSTNEILYFDRIIFFAVAMRRDVLEKVGYLDENFGLAWYEDLDYSIRTVLRGYKNAIAKNIFLFHNHSRTSSKLLDTPEGKALHEKNCLYFNNKHKTFLKYKRLAEIFESSIFYKITKTLVFTKMNLHLFLNNILKGKAKDKNFKKYEKYKERYQYLTEY